MVMTKISTLPHFPQINKQLYHEGNLALRPVQSPLN